MLGRCEIGRGCEVVRRDDFLRSRGGTLKVKGFSNGRRRVIAELTLSDCLVPVEGNDGLSGEGVMVSNAHTSAL